jgi:hypothetical protein
MRENDWYTKAQTQNILSIIPHFPEFTPVGYYGACLHMSLPQYALGTCCPRLVSVPEVILLASKQSGSYLGRSLSFLGNHVGVEVGGEISLTTKVCS